MPRFARVLANAATANISGRTLHDRDSRIDRFGLRAYDPLREVGSREGTRMGIVVRNLVKLFGPVRAVADVSFSVASGEIAALLGPNGAGKTTILRMLATFLPPTSGSASIAGFDCTTDPQEVRRRIGYLPETLPAQPDVRVEEYLHFRARLKDVPRRRRSSEVDRCLECCQLVSVRRRLLGRLSQGYRRRVGLADALLLSPPVLILDEPTIGLDPLQVVHARTLLAGIAQNCSILLSTHLLAEAEALCQRVLVLAGGRLQSNVTLAELRQTSGFELEVRGPASAVAQTLRQMPGVRSVKQLDAGSGQEHSDWKRFNVQSVPDTNLCEQAAAVCHQAGWGLRELRSTGRTLEEHFIRSLLISRDAFNNEQSETPSAPDALVPPVREAA